MSLSLDEAVGHVFFEGWLTGLRMQTGAFVLRGSHGDTPIPAGTRLVASVPAWSIGARVGESTAVLVARDHVTVHGFRDRQEGGAPWRISSATARATRNRRCGDRALRKILARVFTAGVATNHRLSRGRHHRRYPRAGRALRASVVKCIWADDCGAGIAAMRYKAEPQRSM